MPGFGAGCTEGFTALLAPRSPQGIFTPCFGVRVRDARAEGGYEIVASGTK